MSNILTTHTKRLLSHIGHGIRQAKFESPYIAAKDLTRYRSLVWNIIFDSMSNAYPLAARALGTDAWEKLIDCFLCEYNMCTNQYWQTPKELLHYVESCAQKQDSEVSDLLNKHPYLYDLLYFEWLEIKYFNLQVEDFRPFAGEASVDFSQSVRRSPASELFKVMWPVHDVPPQTLINSEPRAHYLLCFRNHFTLEVEYMALSPFHVLFLEQLDGQRTLETILEDIHHTHGLALDQAAKEATLRFLNELSAKGLLAPSDPAQQP